MKPHVPIAVVCSSIIFSSLLEKFGRGQANVVEPTELSIGRAYKVQWKKDKPNLEELAQMYWIEGVTQRQIAKRIGVRRSTISMEIKNFESAYKKQHFDQN